jgi:hypothetical protein
MLRIKGMSQVGYLLLGWLLGILSMLISKWLQSREDKQKMELEILSETLKYLFKVKQIYNNLVTDKSVLDKVIQQFPQKAANLEKQMHENFDKDIKKEFFPDLMFHSFQLKRLDDKSFWKDFERVMNEFEALGNSIVEKANEPVISEHNTRTLELMKAFIEKCNTKTKL